jgi:hypothetical protein
MNLADPQGSALAWATESNALVCTAVMPNGVSALQSVDLSGSYTTGATPSVRLQVAKQGYRYVPLLRCPSLLGGLGGWEEL